MKRAIVAGLALFSMFFGAGNLVFPLLLGEAAGSQNLWAVLGLILTGVLFPLVGLLGIMLFEGDHKRFFGRLGLLGIPLYFIIQLVMAPVGSIPRLLTVSFGSVSTYFPELSLTLFSVIAAALLFALVLRPSKLLDLLGSVLTPVLILSLGAIIVLGLVGHPAAPISHEGAASTFLGGSIVGYGTLDLLAAFLFGRFVLRQFQREGDDRKQILKMFFRASLIATGLLALAYGGLSYVAAFHMHNLPAGLPPEGLLSALATHILGSKGALVANIAVMMACVTTAVTQTAIFTDYLRTDLFRGNLHTAWCAAITVVLSGLFANLGFQGIMAVLKPVLDVAYPLCIGLSIWNITTALRAPVVRKAV